MIKEHEDNVSINNLKINDLNNEFKKYRQEIKYEMNIKDHILDKIKNQGDTYKDELILLRKIIMNKKQTIRYKDRIDQMNNSRNIGKSTNKDKQNTLTVVESENKDNIQDIDPNEESVDE